ncbi:MAG: hypothetical protein ACPGGK_01540 [Pikeienuella sp.]
MPWGISYDTFNDISGAMYLAAGSEVLWTIVSAVICVAALVVGSKHELDAYKKAEDMK